MRGMEDAAFFMCAGIIKLNAMMPQGDYRVIGRKLRKRKKTKRRQQKQSRRKK